MARLAIEAPLDIRLLAGAMSVGEALAGFDAAHCDAGASVSFLGKVRSDHGAKALELTHYEPLTLPGMRELAEGALRRFELDGALAWHRVGVMTPGQPIVLVATAARHRRPAFDAAQFLMDHLKSAAWFWKRERRADGWHWIEPRENDREDLSRWR